MSLDDQKAKVNESVKYSLDSHITDYETLVQRLSKIVSQVSDLQKGETADSVRQWTDKTITDRLQTFES